MSSDATTIIWMHGDALNPQHAVFGQFPQAPAVFVWDDALLHEWRISLKRILFMYECLLEMPVVIRRGDVALEVIRFAQEYSAERIVTPHSPSPRHRQLLRQIRAGLPLAVSIQIIPDQPLITADLDFDLKRFSRYWQTAKKYVLDPDR